MTHHIDFLSEKALRNEREFQESEICPREKYCEKKNMNPEKKQKLEKMENLKVNTEISKNE